ncbi:retrovirus-related pol polyprotein from transposon TNT 1-94 [Tanacetum coccineum]
MLGKKPNKVYDPFLKAGLGYTNPERLKKAIAAQTKMHDGDLIHSNKLVIHSTDSEETLEDAEESRNKMRHKMVQIDYEKLNAHYETFTLSEIKEELIEEVHEMLNIFETMEQKVKGKSPTEVLLQNEIDRLLEVSLTSEIRDCELLSIEQQKHELLKVELEKSANDSRDIQANLLKRIKILENNFQRAQAQIESTIKERENIKLEFQRLFNSIKATRAQHQNEINEMFEDVTQKTYAYADVRDQNQDLLMTISELKNKLRTIKKGKHVNTNFDKSETLGKLVCVTLFNKNLGNKAKNVSNTKVKTDRSKPVTSHLTPKNVQSQKQSANVISRGMYRITKSETQTSDSKTNIHVSNSTCVESSNSVRRPKSKGTKSKNRVLKNTKSSSCEQGKSKKASLPPKLVPSTESKLELLHMDLCGPMRVASINGKKYILVIIDDYSRYTWVYFLRTKDEAPDMIIDFVNQVQRNLKAQILTIRTNNGIEFKNEKLRAFYAKLGIVARTMLIFSTAPEFLWAEAIATACFTQNRFIVHTQYNKTPYELIRGRKPNIPYFHVFESLCYPTNFRDDLGKMKPKADIGIFIGYSESSRGFRTYNRRTKKIMETIHVKFDELTAMASECDNLEPGMNCTNFQDSSKDSQSISSKSDLDNLFGPLYEEYYATSSQEVSDNSAANTLDNEHTSSSSSIVVEEDEAPQIVSSSAE